MDEYTLRDGTVMDLSGLTEAQRRHLASAWAAYESGQDMEAFTREWMHNRSPVFFEGGEVRGRKLLGTEVVSSPLWKILQDLSIRLGQAQGQLSEEPAGTAPIPHRKPGALPS